MSEKSSEKAEALPAASSASPASSIVHYPTGAERDMLARIAIGVEAGTADELYAKAFGSTENLGFVSTQHSDLFKAGDGYHYHRKSRSTLRIDLLNVFQCFMKHRIKYARIAIINLGAVEVAFVNCGPCNKNNNSDDGEDEELSLIDPAYTPRAWKNPDYDDDEDDENLEPDFVRALGPTVENLRQVVISSIVHRRSWRYYRHEGFALQIWPLVNVTTAVLAVVQHTTAGSEAFFTKSRSKEEEATEALLRNLFFSKPVFDALRGDGGVAAAAAATSSSSSSQGEGGDGEHDHHTNTNNRASDADCATQLCDAAAVAMWFLGPQTTVLYPATPEEIAQGIKFGNSNSKGSAAADKGVFIASWSRVSNLQYDSSCNNGSMHLVIADAPEDIAAFIKETTFSYKGAYIFALFRQSTVSSSSSGSCNKNNNAIKESFQRLASAVTSPDLFPIDPADPLLCLERPIVTLLQTPPCQRTPPLPKTAAATNIKQPQKASTQLVHRHVLFVTTPRPSLKGDTQETILASPSPDFLAACGARTKDINQLTTQLRQVAIASNSHTWVYDWEARRALSLENIKPLIWSPATDAHTGFMSCSCGPGRYRRRVIPVTKGSSSRVNETSELDFILGDIKTAAIACRFPCRFMWRRYIDCSVLECAGPNAEVVRVDLAYALSLQNTKDRNKKKKKKNKTKSNDDDDDDDDDGNAGDENNNNNSNNNNNRLFGNGGSYFALDKIISYLSRYDVHFSLARVNRATWKAMEELHAIYDACNLLSVEGKHHQPTTTNNNNAASDDGTEKKGKHQKQKSSKNNKNAQQECKIRQRFLSSIRALFTPHYSGCTPERLRTAGIVDMPPQQLELLLGSPSSKNNNKNMWLSKFTCLSYKRLPEQPNQSQVVKKFQTAGGFPVELFNTMSDYEDDYGGTSYSDTLYLRDPQYKLVAKRDYDNQGGMIGTTFNSEYSLYHRRFVHPTAGPVNVIIAIEHENPAPYQFTSVYGFQIFEETRDGRVPEFPVAIPVDAAEADAKASAAACSFASYFPLKKKK